MKKKMNRKIIWGGGVTTLLLSLSLSGVMFTSMNSSLVASNNETSVNSIQQADEIQSKGIIGQDNNNLWKVKNNNALDLRFANMNDVPSIYGNGGVLTQTNQNGTKYISFFKMSDGGRVENWYKSTYYLIGGHYIAKWNAFVIMDRKDPYVETVRVMCVDANTGTIKSVTNIPKPVGTDYRTFTITQVENAPEAFIIMPRRSMKLWERLFYSFYLKFENNGTSFHWSLGEDKFEDDWDDNEGHRLLSFKAVWIPSLNTHVLVTVIANSQDEVWIRVYEGYGKFIKNANQGHHNLRIKARPVSSSTPLTDRDLWTHYGNNEELFAQFWDVGSSDKRILINGILPGGESKGYSVYYNINDHQIYRYDSNNGVLDFQSIRGLDIDFNYNMHWSNNRLAARPAWARLYDGTNADGNLLEFNWPMRLVTESDFVFGNVIKFNSDLVKPHISATENGMPILMDNNRIGVIKGLDLWVIDKSANNGRGGWAYRTFGRNDTINFNSLTHELAYTYAQDKGRLLKEKAKLNNFPQSSFGQYNISDNNWEFVINENYSDYYKGQIKTRVKFSKGYDANGNLGVVTPSNEITFTGFHQYETSLKNESYALVDQEIKNKPASSITVNELKTFVWNHKDALFNDLPLYLREEQIFVSALNPNNTTKSLQFKITLSYWVNSSHLVESTNKDFNITVTGFQAQNKTTLKQNPTLPAGQFASLVNNQFTTDNAKTLLNKDNNLSLLFETGSLPTGATATITNVKPINTNEVEVKFKLNKYFNDSGILVNGVSQEFTIKVTGFSTQYTTLVKYKIMLPDVGNTYAVSSSVDEEFVKTKLIDALKKDSSIFTNLSHNFDFNTNSVVITNGSLKNYWSTTEPSNSLSEVVIKFKLYGNGVSAPNAAYTSTEFTINIGGFKDSPHSTSLAKSTIDINSNAILSQISASNVNQNHYPEIIKEIVNNNIFTNLKPEQTAVIASDISIRSINVLNNKNGSLTVNATLNSNKAWNNGKPKNYDFSISLTGFQSQSSTQWVNTSLVNGNGLNNIFAHDWTKEDATKYVKNNISQFVVGGYTNNGFTEDDVNVTMGEVDITDKTRSKRKITISLSKHNGPDGQISIEPFEKTFTISGFKPLNINPTKLKTDASRIIFNYSKDVFGQKSLFIADIFQNDQTRQQYENLLKDWLNKNNPTNQKDYASLIFENYAENGLQTKVKAVKFSLSGGTQFSAEDVKIIIELTQAADDGGQATDNYRGEFYANKSGSLLFMKTPKLVFDYGLQGEIGELIDEFNNSSQQDTNALKDKIANKVMKSFNDINSNSPQKFPNVIKEMFDSEQEKYALKQEIINNIFIKNNENGSIANVRIDLTNSHNPLIQAVRPSTIFVSSNPTTILQKDDGSPWLLWILIGSLVVLGVLVLVLLIVYSKKSRTIKYIDEF